MDFEPIVKPRFTQSLLHVPSAIFADVELILEKLGKEPYYKRSFKFWFTSVS